MNKLICYEYKKIWNNVTKLAVISLFIISTLHTFIYLSLQWRTTTDNGKIVEGLQSYRVLKKESKDIEGVVDQKYLDNLVKKYNSSTDKQYFKSNRGYLGTGGMSKYMYPNYLINFAYYGIDMSNGNDKIGLDYKFINSQKEFYKQYKKSVSELIKDNNEWNGMFKYTDKQMDIISKKIDKVSTPFKVEYLQGISNIINWYGLEYWIFLVVITFALSPVFSKDSKSGVDELTLSSTNGRKKDMNARLIAGNMFTLVSYIIFIATLVIEHGLVASLHGWKQSAQLFWNSCLYNINLGTGLLIIFLGGLLGALVITNLIMLISIKTKNTKITVVLSIIIIQVLVKFNGSYNPLKQHLNPLHFNNEDIINYGIFYFIGDIAIPYWMIVILLTIIYILTCKYFTTKSYKKYYLN